MKEETAGPSVAWTEHRERSNMPLLRAARWVALAMGRRASRVVLRLAVLWFVVAAPNVRRASRRYLTRVLGRPARWRDVYRHVFTFGSTVLDRVYLLQGRFEAFSFEASGIEAIMAPFERGEGVLACGAHLGSFEALRMVGHDKGLRVAMIMYEDNARLINDTLAAIAPAGTGLRTIALGRVDAMLTLRRWLDGGGVAGMLADRTLPGNGPRGKTVAIDFLGATAHFADGPFRLAALLKRKVVFMAGIYRGGNRYELRFADLADFTRIGPDTRDAAIVAAVERYVRTVETLCREAPYNWFNFYDFWADAGDDDAS